MSVALEQEEMEARHRRMLGEVAELSMSLARRLHEAAMAAETPDEAQGLALAFQRVSRSLRQTLALEARLERERKRGLAEAAKLQDETRRAAVAARKKLVGDLGSRLIWTEAEKGEIGPKLVKLARWCDAAVQDEEAFLAAPVETLIARLRRDLRLPANDARAAPAPPDEGNDAPAIRSSG